MYVVPTKELPWVKVEGVVHKASPASVILAVAQAEPLAAATLAVVQRGYPKPVEVAKWQHIVDW